MARRKRLSPATALDGPGGPTGGQDMQGFLYGIDGAVRPPPVARIAAEASAQAALDDLAGEVTAARTGGRLVVDLDLSAVVAGHLFRDRLDHDPEEMASLKSSLAARGQQTPIEVVDLGQGRYGLISGARRLAALTALADETKEARYQRIQALIRPHANAPDAYLAMVEENEIRAGLSFYERGRLVAEATRMGLFPTAPAAAKHLFANVPPAKRSKILSFVTLHQVFGAHLAFPGAIPEHLGLALAAAVQDVPGFVDRARQALERAGRAESAAAERAVLEAALRPPAPPRPDAGADEDPAPGDPPAAALRLEGRTGRAVLSGPGVTAAFLADLRAWLAARNDA